MNSLYRWLKRPSIYRIFIWMLNHVPFAIPVKHLRETDSLLAFYHPKPEYPFHVIFLPKKAFRTFADLDPADPFLPDLVTSVHDLVAEYHLTAYRLIINGGEYQEFPHLHFHLASNVIPLPIPPPIGKGARGQGK